VRVVLVVVVVVSLYFPVLRKQSNAETMEDRAGERHKQKNFF
jgi:hypothetical protein